ncbi:Hsp20/alpha crystallin family protein [Thiospirochaeta perfilievii]|uniref:Hsp20/alpha crystallin family protein n=1 Tax=Thiospirochaeta perfilievii TaxID=252967 RepID=A0A5C1Q9L5_9SPIO|nr:Hsp20/alpha crystallin family protein [Thiospirochaeta perfilievii]QEN04823.1 Hsp20/alpha crystallin family protein [Thiospirochaeta perfilievii]
MKEKKNFDFNKLVDGVIDTAKSITETVIEKSGNFAKDSGIKDLKDYYPFYSWPPLNLYTCDDNSLIYEFGLPGFVKDDISILFEDDYMIFSATLSHIYSTGDETRSFKSKLKLGDIKPQKYYLPDDVYDRKNFSMSMKNGLLRLVFKAIER